MIETSLHQHKRDLKLAQKEAYIRTLFKEVTIILYVSVIRPVLEYTYPVRHTNLNRHLTESIETVQKRALKCIYPGNEYADILCLTNLQRLKERRDSLCKMYFQKIMETTHRLLVRDTTHMV